jgi:anti-sigma B factor antagonist
MDNGLVGVTVERDGPVRVLAISGELDVITAPGFAERAARAVADTSRRLILDLSELRFIDCGGARALAAVTRAVPGDCPVLVHSARPIVRRLLDLLGLDLQRPYGKTGALPVTWPDNQHPRVEADRTASEVAGRLVRQSREVWARSRRLLGQSRTLAGVVAATEDTVALTYAQLAERRPARAERLRQLSQHAHQEAVHMRERARDSGQPPARRTDLGRGSAAAREGPLAAWVRTGPSGPVVVLSGEADMKSSGELTELLVSQLSGGARRLTVDVSGLSFADSASVRALVIAAKVFKERGGTLVLLRPQRAVAKVLNLLGADQLIAVREPGGGA